MLLLFHFSVPKIIFYSLIIPIVTSQSPKSPKEICKVHTNRLENKQCLRKEKWTQLRDAVEAAGLVSSEIPTTSAAMANARATPINLMASYKCMDIPCFCKGMGGKTNPDQTCTVDKDDKKITFGRAVRKEYRLLTDQERWKFHSAVHQLKFGEKQSTYNALVYWHAADKAPFAHYGPMFLLWHREFLKRFEFALHQVDPTVVFPFWDSTLDQRLDDPRDSCMWTEDLMGESHTNGTIKNGPFANWTTPKEHILERNFPDPAALFDASNANDTAYYDLLAILAFTGKLDDAKANRFCRDKKLVATTYWPLEEMHNLPHIFIGGEMNNPDISPIDPMFFLHHAFIDYLMERWRKIQILQGEDPSQMYPESLIADDHCAHMNLSAIRPMLPFLEIRNELGLNVNYTKNLYVYEPPPYICTRTQGCRSRFLFCHYENGARIGYCAAKIRVGGNCRKFSTPPTSSQTALPSDQTNPCYKGRCQSSGTTWRCVNPVQTMLEENDQADIDLHAVAETTTCRTTKYKDLTNKLTTSTTTTDRPKKIERPKANIEPFRNCYNFHTCCGQWYFDGYCEKAPEFMNTWCPLECEYDGCRRLLRSFDICFDEEFLCQGWVKRNKNECKDNEQFMSVNCKKTCGLCRSKRAIDCSGGPAAKGFYINKDQLNLPKFDAEDDE